MWANLAEFTLTYIVRTEHTTHVSDVTNWSDTGPLDRSVLGKRSATFGSGRMRKTLKMACFLYGERVNANPSSIFKSMHVFVPSSLVLWLSPYVQQWKLRFAVLYRVTRKGHGISILLAVKIYHGISIPPLFLCTNFELGLGSLFWLNATKIYLYNRMINESNYVTHTTQSKYKRPS